MMPEVIKNNWAYVFGLLGPLAFFSVYALWIPILLLLLCNADRVGAAFQSRDYSFCSRYWPYFLLPVFGGVSALWALVPADALSTSGKFAGYFVAAILVGMILRQITEDEKRKIIFSTAGGFLIAFPFVILDITLAGGISSLYKSYEFNPNMYSRGAAITACVLFPLGIGLFRYMQPARATIIVLICLGMIFGLYMEAAKLAVIVGLIVFGLVHWQRKLFWPVVILPLLVALIFPVFFKSPLTEQQQCRLHYTMDSAYHRVMIYQFSTSKILDKPVAGWGMDSSRTIPGGASKVGTINCIRPDGQPTKLSIGGKLPLHPHNAAIQIWLELGAIGSLLLTGVVLLLIKRFEREFEAPEGRAVIAATFCVTCLIYNVSFVLWQSWLMFSLILLGSIVMSLQRHGKPVVEN